MIQSLRRRRDDQEDHDNSMGAACILLLCCFCCGGPIILLSGIALIASAADDKRAAKLSKYNRAVAVWNAHARQHFLLSNPALRWGNNTRNFTVVRTNEDQRLLRLRDTKGCDGCNQYHGLWFVEYGISAAVAEAHMLEYVIAG